MTAGLWRAGPTLARGIRSNFVNTYYPMYKGVQKLLGGVCHFDERTDELVSLFGYRESVPKASYTPWGEAPESKPVSGRNFTIEVYRNTHLSQWLRYQRQLAKLGDLLADARQGAARMAQLTERKFFQQLTGVSDPTLAGPTTLLAPDGKAMFSATGPGTSDRFGVLGGNILTGQTLTTGAGLRTAFFLTTARFANFQDTEGEPLLPQGLLGESGQPLQKYLILFPNALRDAMAQAFKQTFPAYAASGENAGVSNVVMESGYQIQLLASQRLTDTSAIYVFSQDLEDSVKPFIELTAMDVEEHYYDATYPDQGKRGVEELMYEMWRGWGLNLPYGCVKVTT